MNFFMLMVSRLLERLNNENKVPVTIQITGYAFSRTAPRKRGSFRSSRSQASRTSGAFCPSRQKNVVSSQYASDIERSVCRALEWQLRLRGPHRVECLFPHGAYSWWLPRVVADPDRLRGDSGQHTPHAHGRPL